MRFAITLPCEEPQNHVLVESTYYSVSGGIFTGCHDQITIPVGEIDYQVRIPVCGCYAANHRELLEAFEKVTGIELVYSRGSTYRGVRAYEYGVCHTAHAKVAEENLREEYLASFRCDFCGKPQEPKLGYVDPSWAWSYREFKLPPDIVYTLICFDSNSKRCCSQSCWIGLANNLKSLLDHQRKEKECLKKSRKTLGRIKKLLPKASENRDALQSLREELNLEMNSRDSCQT